MTSTGDDNAVSAEASTTVGTATVMSSALTLNRVRGGDVAVHLKR
jgi:hypothetical protein